MSNALLQKGEKTSFGCEMAAIFGANIYFYKFNGMRFAFYWHETKNKVLCAVHRQDAKRKELHWGVAGLSIKNRVLRTIILTIVLTIVKTAKTCEWRNTIDMF